MWQWPRHTFVNSPLSWFGLECPCTGSAKSQSKCTSSSMSVLSLPLSILHTQEKWTAWIEIQTKSMTFIGLLNPIRGRRPHVSDFPVYLRADLSKKKKKSAQKKHETSGCRQGVTSRSHKITLPPGPYLQQTLTPRWQKRTVVISWWLLVSLLKMPAAISDERERKTHASRKVQVCSAREVTGFLSRSVSRRLAESGFSSSSVFPHFVKREKKNLSTQHCLALIPKDPVLVMS